MSSERPIEELAAEARYHRDRYALYQAKAYGPRATSPVRLRELQRAAEAAEERLATAKAARASESSTATAGGDEPGCAGREEADGSSRSP